MATDYPKPDSLLVGPRGVGQPYDACLTVISSLTPAAVNSASTAEQTFTITGLLTSDQVDITNQPARTGSVCTAGVRVSAANTVAITYINPTAGSLTPPAGNYTFQVWRLSTNPSK